MKRAMNRQPIRDIVDADRTTTITLPAMLTNAPSPAPTMIWASCTMHVSAAQSTPVPRSCPAGFPFPIFLCTWCHNRKNPFQKCYLLYKKHTLIVAHTVHPVYDTLWKNKVKLKEICNLLWHITRRRAAGEVFCEHSLVSRITSNASAPNQ